MVDPGERVTVGCPLGPFFGLESMFWFILSCWNTVYHVVIVFAMYVCMFYITGAVCNLFVVILSRIMCVIFLCDFSCL